MEKVNLQTIREEQGSFIKSGDELRRIAQDFPHQLILVRCGCGRFVAPAQDTEHFVAIITKCESDYVRDVSLYTP